LISRVVCIFSRFQRSTGHEHLHFREALANYRKVLSIQNFSEERIEARIKLATESTERLSPMVPVVERLLGPAKPTAEVLASLDRGYEVEGKPSVYYLELNQPIVPHLESLLRPRGDLLSANGVAASDGGAYADAIVFFDAALDLMPDEPAMITDKLLTRLTRAAATRELGLVEQSRDQFSKLLLEVGRLPGSASILDGLIRYQLALCYWRLGDRAAAQRAARESLVVYDSLPKSEVVGPALRRQSDELLGIVNSGQAPAPPSALDAPAALLAARDRYRACVELTRLGLDHEAVPIVARILGPARPVTEVLQMLDRRYRDEGKPAVWFLPLNKPISPHLDELIGRPALNLRPDKHPSRDAGPTTRPAHAPRGNSSGLERRSKSHWAFS
jgi:tetratricopeptide (TPR) repeat protein